jgi:RNA polymerase sigma-70 factor (ECF subfamily)
VNRSAHHFVALLEAARDGDRSALGNILDGFRSYLQLLADRKLGADLKPKCGGSDLVQRTFIDAQEAFGRFEGSHPDELLAWLERILLNNLSDLARQFRVAEKRQIQREMPLGEILTQGQQLLDQSSPSKKAARHEEHDKLRQALAGLPQHYRDVIVLRNLERCKFEDIGRKLGRSTEAVKKLWSRAIMQLRNEMK